MIHLFRHGHVDGPAALYGKTDIALSENGQKALSRAIRGLPKPQLIVTSPLQRCHHFAAHQAQNMMCALKVEDDFREMNFGQWDGAPYCEDSPSWQAMKQFWQQPATVTPPGGESLPHMQNRVTSAWRRLVAECEETTWVFAHGGVIRLILAELLQLDWRNPALYSVLQIGYASRTDISYQQLGHSTITRVQAVAVPAPLSLGPTRAVR